LTGVGASAKVAVKALVKMLDDEAKPIRLAAIQSLGFFADDSDLAAKTLHKAAEGEDEEVAAAAATALSKASADGGDSATPENGRPGSKTPKPER
jgi:hypothetical protein